MKTILFLIALLSSFSSVSSTLCHKEMITINSTDLTKKINKKSSDSNENINRDFFIYSTGEMLILNQKHCLMSNYDISYYYQFDSNRDEAFNKIIEILNNILKHEDLVTNKEFNKNLKLALLNNKLDNNDFNLSKNKNDDNIEHYFHLTKQEDDIYNFRLSLYIGIGGL
ncbi:hypothetical protein [uncultured Photobacterium sp.]|uniref:hypothetical protein n=1 Tax=uncultured Photobacterium sp. TaxID=173973 RepID=UPI0026262DC7|nr:hypothetical protein [uncultured Photobacterium sp.]